MSDDILSVEEAAAAEPWLLPDFQGKKVVSSVAGSVSGAGNSGAENAQASGRASAQQMGGFRRSARPASAQDSAAPRRIPRAITASQVQSIEQQARDEGFSEGRAEGYEKGYAEGEARAQVRAREVLEGQQQTLAYMIEAMIDPLQTQRDELQQLLAELSGRIAECLSYQALREDNGSIATVVSEAIAALPIGEQQLQLLLNPADLETLQALPDFIQPHWQLHADEQLQLGDCKIRSEHALVDFTRSTRLREILAATFDMSFDSAFRSQTPSATAEQD